MNSAITSPVVIDNDLETPTAVFIVSRKSSYPYRRVLWRVSKTDAMKICGDPRTSNYHHMLCWTAQDIEDPKFNRYVKDSGKYDAVLRDHNIAVLTRG